MNEYILTATLPQQEHTDENCQEPGPINKPIHTPHASTISTSYQTRESKANILIKDKGSVRDIKSLSSINPLPIQIINSLTNNNS